MNIFMSLTCNLEKTNNFPRDISKLNIIYKDFLTLRLITSYFESLSIALKMIRNEKLHQHAFFR